MSKDDALPTDILNLLAQRVNPVKYNEEQYWHSKIYIVLKSNPVDLDIPDTICVDCLICDQRIEYDLIGYIIHEHGMQHLKEYKLLTYL